MDKETSRGEAGIPGTLDSIDIAMNAERHDPAPDSPARRVLLKNERLIEAQTAQLGRQRWRDFIITALGVCLLASAGLLVWDASQAKGVVVEPFAVPPDLAERGLSGPVLATQMLDRLMEMQAQTESLRAASTYANDWGEDITVEIADTGVSIGELRRYLRDWLGDQTRLSGEVFRLTDGRIAVTARAGGRPATRAEGAVGDLDELLRKQAEAIYAETQPYRYSVWLSRRGRIDEARVVLNALIAGEDLNDRLWGYNGLAVNDGTTEGAQRYYAAALRLRPDFVPAISNRAATFSAEGRDEQAYQGYKQVLDHQAAARRELEPGRADAVINTAQNTLATFAGDPGRAARLSEARIGLPESKIAMAIAPVNAILAYAEARDLPSARRLQRENGLNTPEGMARIREEWGPDIEFDSIFAWAVGDHATGRDHLASALAALDGYERDPRQPDPAAEIRARLAYAYARLGQFAEARATIAPTALNCAPCVRARGLIEAYAGNPGGADHWLSEAARIAPSLPAAHVDWAEAYLVRRDPANAIVQARLAVEKGPKWADPRKHWGDALMMQGRPEQAARRYREAVRLAPNWGALHLALGRAEAAAGRDAAARESFRTAARLDLNPADRVEAARLTGGAGAGLIPGARGPAKN